MRSKPPEESTSHIMQYQLNPVIIYTKIFYIKNISQTYVELRFEEWGL